MTAAEALLGIAEKASDMRACKPGAEAGMQLWGGIECTINRVGDRYFSQLARSGHIDRSEDLDLFAALGIKAIRYPVLWEHIAPDGLQNACWSWPDRQLERLRELAVEPIVGLLHHGSGPRYSTLVDADFPEALASYAAAVAHRYPWVSWYTPVNEPLTTARFSGLYGLWYPHGRDAPTFWKALMHECRGIVLAMRAIRRVNPGARLLQTDDLGKTYSGPQLQYQAGFNNELRWLAWDLLCGMVDRQHPLWDWLTRCCRAHAGDILWFREHPCAPDVLGVNHYVTSERVLDERIDCYPPHLHGGNGRHRYVDVEAARCLARPTAGLQPLLMEAWQRYRLPIAITEAHIDSTRDDQLRWITEVWRSARDAQLAGVDMRAVTVWALLGSYDWNSLLTENRGYYEPGAFDLRGGHPRPTAVARLMQRLARGNVPAHPLLSWPGWWRREARITTSPIEVCQDTCASGSEPAASVGGAPLLIVGTGTLGRAFAHVCGERGLSYRLLSRQELDIAEPGSIERACERHQPWAVINAAGYVRVDEAERDAEQCYRDNTRGACTLAAYCEANRIPLVTFSSDLVFDGGQRDPYLEDHPTAPLNVYGHSKAQAEIGVLERYPEALVVRTSSFFGPWDTCNYVTVALRALREGRTFAAANDVTVSPTYMPDLVHACLDLLIDGEAGIWHLTNNGAVTWADLAQSAAQLSEIDCGQLQPCRSADLGLWARRPRYSVLGSSRSSIMPTLDDALGRYVQHCSAQVA